MEVKLSRNLEKENEQLRAENRAYRDRQARYGFTDDAGQAVELCWADAHKTHIKEKDPYIGCPFCHDKFILKSDAEIEITRLRNALKIASDDLYKAANQFAGLGYERNPDKFEKKAKRAEDAVLNGA